MEDKTEKQRNGVKTSKKEESDDIIQNIIGQFGKYQLFICVLMFLPKFPIAFLQQSVVFIAPRVSYICPDTGNQTCPCKDPVYDRSIFTNSVIMQWDLICDRRWLNSLLQTIFSLGTLVGSPLIGMASDRFGRRWPFIICMVLQGAAGIAASFMSNYWAFAFCRFICGACLGGSIATSFIILMEFIGKEHRDTVSYTFQAVYNTGYMVLPVLGYYLRNYSDFHLAVSIPSLFVLIYVFFLPETPRWLITENEKERAVKLLQKVATINNRPTEKIRLHVDAYRVLIENSQKKGTILDLFRTPNLRKNILAMSFNWLACSFCFFGLGQYMGQLEGNVFLNVAMNGGVALIGTIGFVPLLRVIGRRNLFIVLNLSCAGSLLALAATPDGTASVIFAFLGYLTSLTIFFVAYLYCAELFPTVIRNAAMGFSSMSARVGSMVAPFAIDLQIFGGWAPPLAFAVLPLIAAFVTLLLPETKGCELMNTLEEGENFGKQNKNPKS